MAKTDQPYEGIYHSRKSIFFNNLIGGIGWSIGATLGFAVFVAILSFIATQINFVPIIGSYIAEINTFVVKHTTR